MAEWPKDCDWVRQELEKRGRMDLFSRLVNLRDKIIPDLDRISHTFPEYTIHDVRHKDQVTKILGWLVPKEIIEEFSPYEIFFLISATYIHDVGMADLKDIFDEIKFREWIAKDGKDCEQINQRREFIRQYHHLRSKDYILSNYSDFYIDNPAEAQIITLIAMGHRNLEDLKDHAIFPRKWMYQNNNTVNIAALAYYLQIADELDLTYERAPLTIYESFAPSDPTSQLEWKKSLDITGVGLDGKIKRKILVTAFCKERQVHRALLILESKIQAKLDVADQILDQYQSNYFPSRIHIEIIKVGYEALDLEIVFEMKSMIPLLSDHIYQGHGDAIREFLQNSIDACRRRLLILGKTNSSFSPHIYIRDIIYLGKPAIQIEDNGEGMDENILSNYFGKIGRSYYSSSEFTSENPNFNSISEFGVGILSGFMIADSIILETKSERGSPYHIELFPTDRRILAIKGTRSEVGTTIILPLKNGENIDYLKEIKKFASHVEVPVTVEQAGNKFEVKPTWLGFKDFNPKSSATQLPDLIIEWSTTEYSAVASFPAELDPIFGVISAMHHPKEDPTFRFRTAGRISRRGIFVQELPVREVLMNFGIRGTLDIDVLTNTVQIDAGRSRFKQDKNYLTFVSKVRHDFVEKLKTIFDSFLAKDSEVFKKNSLDLVARYVPIQKYPDGHPIKQLLEDYVYFETLSKDGVQLMRVGDLDLQVEALTRLPPVTTEELYIVAKNSNCPLNNRLVLIRRLDRSAKILGRSLPIRSYKSLFGFSPIEAIHSRIRMRPANLKKFPLVRDIEFDFLTLFNSSVEKLFLSLDPIEFSSIREDPVKAELKLSINMNHPALRALIPFMQQSPSGFILIDKLPEILGSYLNQDFEKAEELRKALFLSIGCNYTGELVGPSDLPSLVIKYVDDDDEDF